MYTCQYDLRTGGRGCQKERALDFKFCPEHLDTPRGRQHIMDVVQARQLTKPSQVEEAIAEAKKLPEGDYHTTALEQMADTLETIQGWVDECRSHLDSLTLDQWRYKDRAQQEQLHSYVALYERALDRVSKHLGAMSKVSLHDKMVSLGKAQVDMMIRMIMSVVSELRLSDDTARRAQSLLLDLIEREGNLTARVENYAQNQLTSNEGHQIIDEAMAANYAQTR
jgi:hypothetical protein